MGDHKVKPHGDQAGRKEWWGRKQQHSAHMTNDDIGEEALDYVEEDDDLDSAAGVPESVAEEF